MRVYRYWAYAQTTGKDIKGKTIALKKWGGSNDSHEDALHIAQNELRKTLQRIAGLDLRRHLKDDYAYTLRDKPEELLEEWNEQNLITRNRAGVSVLNSGNVMFVDVDLPPTAFGWLIALFKGNAQTRKLAILEQWLAQNPAAGARVYQTAGGMRYLITHAELPVKEKTLGWLRELEADPLYSRLCKAQQCYRARLTPKAWRMKQPLPPNLFPHDKEGEKAAFAKWLTTYEKAAEKYAVCQFLAQYGKPAYADEVSVIIEQHDRATKAHSTLPLA